MSDLKICSSCRTAKPLDAFSNAPSSSDGRAHRCRDCNAERVRAYRATPKGLEASRLAARRMVAKYRERNAVA